MTKLPEGKVKTTILISKTLKKLAQVHAIQNDMTLQGLIEKALRNEIIEREEKSGEDVQENETENTPGDAYEPSDEPSF